MSRLAALHLCAAVLLFATPQALAGNVAVGICRPKLPSYSSISAAVAGVPAGTTIEVCPNTYFEQVFITQPLTLEGIASGNSADVVIEPPGSGLTTVTDSFGETIAPIVAVSATGVNISNITVDGTGNTVDCTSSTIWLIGIFYGDGSSGTVNEVTARNMKTTNCGTGTGVWAESTIGNSVTIENGSFHDNEDSSILTIGNLVATVKGNSMAGCFFCVQWSSAGTMSGNVIDGAAFVGILYSDRGTSTISGNTITNSASYGVFSYFGLGGSTVFNSNKISNSPYGINVGESGDTFKSNTITKTGIGMEFNCKTQTVASNVFNDATTGLNDVPASFGGANKFDNVGTIRTDGCARPSKKGPQAPGKPGVPLPAPSH